MKKTQQHQQTQQHPHGNGVAGKGVARGEGGVEEEEEEELQPGEQKEKENAADGARSEASSHRPWGRSFRHQLCFWYATILSKYPVWLCLLMFIGVVGCGAIAFALFDYPDFDDPIAGFEPRGTPISKRTISWRNMMNQTGTDLPLSPYPVSLPSYRPDTPNNVVVNMWPVTEEPLTDTTDNQGEEFSSVGEQMSEGDFEYYGDADNDVIKPSTLFCGNPKPMYARLVFEPIDGDSLFTVEGLHSMCQLEDDHIRRHIEFLRDCYTNEHTGNCCASWSLANYVAVLNNKTSCMDINHTDIKNTIQLLHLCSHFYRSKELPPNCTIDNSDPDCRRLPIECTQYDAVYSILHYIVDVNFMSIEKTHNEKVQHAVTLIPMYAGNDMREIYDDNFDHKTIKDETTKITGLYFNLKYDIFEEYLTQEVYLPALGITLVILLMWIYVGSLFITVMTIISMIMSLILAYFVYRAVLQIPFFPFMNLTTIILLVGIGADDAFVYTDLWKRTRGDHPNTPEILVVMETLRHAAVSMFVTSFTTSSAFFANAVSNITSIKCFGIFAGTAILLNFVFTITWLPAVVVIYEQYFAGVFNLGKEKRESRTYLYKKKTCCDLFVDLLFKIRYTTSEWSRIFFDKILPCIVVKLRFIWLLTMGTLMFGGFCLIFLDPKLQLPTLPEFQLFESMHPFERYDFVYKDMFWFEKEKSGSLYAHMPITVVWGIKASDNGDYYDPGNKGSLVFDDAFNIAHPESQRWLLHFCSSLRNQSFYFPTPGLDVEACFIETFKKWMESRDCVDSYSEADLTPCCKETSFPYPASVFKTCLKEGITHLHKEYPTFFQKWKPGPRFSGEDNDVVAAIVEFDSTFTFSYSYDEIYEYVSTVQAWVNKELKTAPYGMQGGWVTSYLEFYDLQNNLARGTPIALGLAIIIATCVMFLTTQNLLISVYAILSISGTICVTIGALVLMGWQLNILESVILSVAVGLSIDFTVHYGVAYRIAPDTDRESRVVFSLARMGSAISMAALTTFVAGGLMLPSTILSYRQMGTFLMLIMVISWMYSTFFFQSLCRTIGPEGRLGQFPLPSCNCECTKIHAAKIAEDSDGSNSFHSSTVPSSGESHELEPLNAYSASDYSTSGVGSSINGNNSRASPGNISRASPAKVRANNHVELTTTSLDHFLALPVSVANKPSSSTASSMEVVLEGDEYITKVCPPKVPEDLIINVSIETEPVVKPNNNPDVPDIWVPLTPEITIC